MKRNGSEETTCQRRFSKARELKKLLEQARQDCFELVFFLFFVLKIVGFVVPFFPDSFLKKAFFKCF